MAFSVNPDTIRCRSIDLPQSQQSPSLIDDKGDNPGQDKLIADGKSGPGPGIGFSFDSGNGSHTGGVNERKRHKRIGG